MELTDPLSEPAAGPVPGAVAVKIPVALARCSHYERDAVARVVAELLSSLGYHPARGERVLVKPNLLRVEPSGLACTHPLVVRAACLYLLDHDCRIVVADSPGYGTGTGVAKGIGLLSALKDIPGHAQIQVSNFSQPVQRPLTCGGTVGIARQALEADSICNLPKLKAHSQMRMTGAVKNLFGCVPGIRKAMLHARHGDKGRAFPSMLVDVANHLPPVFSLLDGIIAMHKTGPAGGEAYPAGLLAASPSYVAIDTALYSLLGLPHDMIPIWDELIQRGSPGSLPGQLEFLGEAAEHFDFTDFQVPHSLRDQSFSPVQFVKSACRRLWFRLVN